ARGAAARRDTRCRIAPRLPARATRSRRGSGPAAGRQPSPAHFITPGALLHGGDFVAKTLDVDQPRGGVLHVAPGAGGVPLVVETREAAVEDRALAVRVVVGGDEVVGVPVAKRLQHLIRLDRRDGD